MSLHLTDADRDELRTCQREWPRSGTGQSWNEYLAQHFLRAGIERAATACRQRAAKASNLIADGEAQRCEAIILALIPKEQEQPEAKE